MVLEIQAIPRFSKEEARALAIDLFDVTATARTLPSERDQNFLLDLGAGPAYVLKIANASETREAVEGQNAVLEHVASRDSSLGCPRLRPTRSGEPIGTAKGPQGARHLVRLLTYVPGHLLVDVSPHSPKLLRGIGAFFGRLHQTLEGFSHPALKRELQWDLKHAGEVIGRHIEHIADGEQRALVEHFHSRFRKIVQPLLPSLRTSVIHNDGNDYNVLVTGTESCLLALGGEVTGVIDFGDVVESHTVFEPAVCAAYAVLGKTDPVFAAAQVVSGYHGVNPLTEQEVELLYDLIAMRLCLSVTISAHQKKRHSDNAYLTVSEGPAWAALARLARLSPRLFSYAFRNACGLATCPRTVAVVRWLQVHTDSIGPVVRFPSPPKNPARGVPGARQMQPVAGSGSSREGEGGGEKYLIFDLSPGSSNVVALTDPADVKLLTQTLFDQIRASGAYIGIGRYNEARRAYSSAQYRSEGSEVEEWRTVHLGMDLFMEPGSPVLAPLDGTVHSFRNNAQPLDYGPTVILRHELKDLHAPGTNAEFFTLYGHLTEESLKGLSAGMPITKGAQIGVIGDSSINGHWPPHLHFQVILDLLDHAGNFPGVCAARDRSLWLSLCPDPNLILRIPEVHSSGSGEEHEQSPEEILEARKRYLGPNLSVTYEKPLKIVRGWRQYLYDHLGREFLDAVDNVAHVGHCHPRVVRAAQEQMATVNTNTRYLHDRIVEYAERLCATLPDPLRVCYFVCSGSEANELALRMAHAHTKGTDIIVVEGAYHGNTGYLIDISPYKFDGPGGAGAPPYVHKVTMPDGYRGPFKGDRDAGRLYAQEIRDALQGVRQAGRRVAAFISESMLSCGGQIVLPAGYLADAYRYARAAGAVCIADEIQVGFGRVGSQFWGFQTQAVVPDIVTMGKPMGNGHPLAAVVTTSAIAASFANGMEYFNTFGGNPVSCAVGLAVLDVLEEERLQSHALTVGAYLKKSLRRLMEKHPLIGDVRGEGLFLGVELVRDPQTLEPATAETSYLAERMKDLGVLIGVDGVYRNVLKIKPPMVFTNADADRLTSVLERALSEPRLRVLGAVR